MRINHIYIIGESSYMATQLLTVIGNGSSGHHSLNDLQGPYIYNHSRKNYLHLSFKCACVKILVSYVMCSYSEKVYHIQETVIKQQRLDLKDKVVRHLSLKQQDAKAKRDIQNLANQLPRIVPSWQNGKLAYLFRYITMRNEIEYSRKQYLIT